MTGWSANNVIKTRVFLMGLQLSIWSAWVCFLVRPDFWTYNVRYVLFQNSGTHRWWEYLVFFSYLTSQISKKIRYWIVYIIIILITNTGRTKKSKLLPNANTQAYEFDWLLGTVNVKRTKISDFNLSSHYHYQYYHYIIRARDLV